MAGVKKFEAVRVDDHVVREVLSDSPTLMVVAFSFAAGGVGAPHSHIHTQATYVESGRFSFHIEGEEFEVAQGESFVIPSNAVHGCTCLEAGRLVDTFSPRRDDFL